MKLSAAGGNRLVSDVAAEGPADWLSTSGSWAMKAMAAGEKEEVIGWEEHKGAGHVLEFFGVWLLPTRWSLVTFCMAGQETDLGSDWLKPSPHLDY